MTVIHTPLFLHPHCHHPCSGHPPLLPRIYCYYLVFLLPYLSSPTFVHWKIFSNWLSGVGVGVGSMICSACQFLWCKHSHSGWFHATNMTLLNTELEEMHIIVLSSCAIWLLHATVSNSLPTHGDGKLSQLTPLLRAHWWLSIDLKIKFKVLNTFHTCMIYPLLPHQPYLTLNILMSLKYAMLLQCHFLHILS